MKNLTVVDYIRLGKYWKKLRILIPDFKKLSIKDLMKFKKQLSNEKGKDMEDGKKAGVKTSEFWVSISTAIAGLLLTLGWIGPEAQAQLPVAVGQIAGGIVTLVSIISYIWSRTNIKKTEIKEDTQKLLVEKAK